MPAGAIGPLSERRPEAGDGGRRCWGDDRAAEGGGKGGRWHLPTPYFSSSVGLHMLLALRRPPAAGPLGRAGRAGAAHGAGAAAAPPPPPSPSAGAQLRGRRSAAPASGCPRPAGPGLRRPEVRGGGRGGRSPPSRPPARRRRRPRFTTAPAAGPAAGPPPGPAALPARSRRSPRPRALLPPLLSPPSSSSPPPKDSRCRAPPPMKRCAHARLAPRRPPFPSPLLPRGRTRREARGRH